MLSAIPDFAMMISFIILCIGITVAFLIFLEYKCKAPRVVFFWGGMIAGWIEMFILLKFIVDLC